MSKEKSRSNNIGKFTQEVKPHNSLVKILVVVALIICLIVGIILFMSLNNNNDKGVKSYNAVVTPDNIQQVIEQMDSSDYTPIGSYEVNMNSDWVFPNGSAASTNAYVGNSVNNTNDVYFTLSLDDNSIVLTSPVIPVGSHIENIKLDKELDKGNYSAVIKYYLLDSAGNETSNVSVKVNLTIEN